MPKNVSQKLIESHLVSGEMTPGEEIGIKIDQTLCQDATGTMVMLELEAMGVDKVKTEVSAQYIDHNVVQNDFKNADDHVFLRSACQKFGVWFSRPGNGVSHPVHMENFGKPGKTLIGSDSHTCAAGSMGMLSIGAGGLEVALAMAGEPFYTNMPEIIGVKVTGQLQDWVSAKDVILEMLRRHSVKGGVGKIYEYYGPGLKNLTAMDRHVIANMGAELGATATVFPSDDVLKEYMVACDREADWSELVADEGATYDGHDEIDLSKIEPLIALPVSPDNVVPVSEVAGQDIFQSMIGSSANPGLRDFAIASMIVKGKMTHDRVSFDINPSSRMVLENLTHLGYLEPLIHSGGRIHQAGCNGCIGMGQAPATDRISLRTVPRNFPGRSGTKEDKVHLCSPEVAAASALTGVITDPRTLDMPYPKFEEPKKMITNRESLLAPDPSYKEGLVMGPNIKSLPIFPALEKKIQGPVLLKMGDNISTDTISPAGSLVLPFRSNIPEIAKFSFRPEDETFYDRAIKYKDDTGFVLVAGENYGQGSSREHAALAPRYLGLRSVIVKSFARIHRKNLINFGVLPLIFKSEADYKAIKQGDVLELNDVTDAVENQRDEIEVCNKTQNTTFMAKIVLSPKERSEVLAGGLMNVMKARKSK